MPLQKSSGVATLVSLQECGVFQNITVHRETNSGKPQAKIRLAFFERNNRIASEWHSKYENTIGDRTPVDLY